MSLVRLRRLRAAVPTWSAERGAGIHREPISDLEVENPSIATTFRIPTQYVLTTLHGVVQHGIMSIGLKKP
jgi:hypothetical protein